ncbi:MAG: alpha/beta hydrolase [Oleiphilaceae bacterium]|nr:alpha/beta hydrolase [Oleiphilaceae bacterium]
MKFFEEQLFASDGLPLQAYRWIPSKAHAAVVLSHGWSEHAGRYHELAAWLASKGYEVHAIDHRGHGKSGGKRGHVRKWVEYSRDLEQLRQTVEPDHQYLLGHSMGGMIATLHLMDYPGRFKAAALSGPAADLSYKVPQVKVWVSRALSAWAPSFCLAGDVDAAMVCGNEDIVQSYANDPYTHGQVSVRWFVDYMRMIDRVKREAPRIATPVGIWHGEGDSLVAPWVSEALFERLQSAERQREVVEGALHEILFEKNWRQTAKRMLDWLELY